MLIDYTLFKPISFEELKHSIKSYLFNFHIFDNRGIPTNQIVVL